MRKIHTIVFHCSASDHKDHNDVAVMRKWHKAKGWSDVGYHYFIKRDGTIQEGRPIERIGAHVRGFNSGTVAVCFHGLNTFTKAQMKAARKVIPMLEKKIGKQLKVRGHHDYTTLKTCPNFVIRRFLKGELKIIKRY